MVGHSQGGMMPRYYIKNLGGAALRRRPRRPRTVEPRHDPHRQHDGSATSSYCPACDQQGTGSAFLEALNHPDETPGGVDYTQVETNHDEVVVPYTSAFLAPGAHSTNILLQDRCPADPVEHVGIPMDPQAIAWVLNAFHRSRPGQRQGRRSAAPAERSADPHAHLVGVAGPREPPPRVVELP